MPRPPSKPRPPTPEFRLNKVYHVLNIPEAEQEFIRETVKDLKDAYLQVHGIKAAGRVLQGALSHPVGYLSVIGAIIIAAHTIPGVRDAVVAFEKKQAEAAGVAVEEFVKTGIRNVTEGSAARTEDERLMYEQWIDSLWDGIRWVFQF